MKSATIFCIAVVSTIASIVIALLVYTYVLTGFRGKEPHYMTLGGLHDSKKPEKRSYINNIVGDDTGDTRSLCTTEACLQEMVGFINRSPSHTFETKLNPSMIGYKDVPPTIDFPKVFDVITEAINMTREAKFRQLYFKHVTKLLSIQHVPKEFELAEEWPACARYVLHVKDQGGCGSCWAVSSASALTDRLCMQSRGRLKRLVSPQHILECCSYCGRCDGIYKAYLAYHFLFEQGACDEQRYPYSMAVGCGNPCQPATFGKKGLGQCARKCGPRHRTRAQYYYEIGSYIDYGLSLESAPLTLQELLEGRMSLIELVKRDIIAFGPVTMCFNAHESFFHYFDGVYNYDGDLQDQVVYGHCVKVVGWGFEKYQEYLSAVNTWGQWAHNGTFKIAVQSLPLLQVEFFAAVPEF